MKKILLLCVVVLTTCSLFSQNHNPVINYEYNGTPKFGVKIRTNIPYGTPGMPTIIIEGYEYSSNPIGIILNWYVYKEKFYAAVASSFGNYTPPIKLYNEDGKITIFIDDRTYYDRFSIRAYSGGLSLTEEHFKDWKIEDALPQGEHERSVEYKNKFAGNITFPYGIWNSYGNVGIGTNSPGKSLEVKGNDGVGIRIFNQLANTWDILNTQYGKLDFVRGGSNTYMRIDQYGNVGIGTTNIDSRLTVAGNVNVGGTGNSSIKVRHIDGKDFDSADEDHLYLNYRNRKNVWIGAPNNPANLISNGKVAVGLTNIPSGYTMAVAGKIIAEEMKVKLQSSGWPDYVFEDNYNLPTLEEVESFIKEKGHLKDIPSAKEVGQNGILLGEMDTKLLRKIEELTLYTISQKKLVDSQQKEIDKLNQLLVKFEKRIENLESQTKCKGE